MWIFSYISGAPDVLPNLALAWAASLGAILLTHTVSRCSDGETTTLKTPKEWTIAVSGFVLSRALIVGIVTLTQYVLNYGSTYREMMGAFIATFFILILFVDIVSFLAVVSTTNPHLAKESPIKICCGASLFGIVMLSLFYLYNGFVPEEVKNDIPLPLQLYLAFHFVIVFSCIGLLVLLACVKMCLSSCVTEEYHYTHNTSSISQPTTRIPLPVSITEECAQPAEIVVQID